MRSFSRRIIAAVLSLTMIMGMAGCSKTETSESTLNLDIEEGRKGERVPTEPPTKGPTNETSYTSSSVDGNKLTGVNYVMIYDPLIYDEADKPSIMGTSLTTGDLEGLIVTGQSRAGDTDPEELGLHDVISQSDINQGISDIKVDRTAYRASGFDPVYKRGDKHKFYHYDQNLTKRLEDKFECVYAGSHCYIWSLDDSINDKDAEMFGKEFDNVIYDKDVQYFGTPRFTENGGKINILFYPLRRDLCGFFTNYDIYSSTEVTSSEASLYGLNTDHAIININSSRIKIDSEYIKSTLSHEFQHLICASEYFVNEDNPSMRTWLNESMSAYAEDLVYPGIKDKEHYNILFYLSDKFRKGQSLYNFSIENDQYIGSYGVVYLFAKYLANHAGSDVFSKIHKNWGEGGNKDLTEAEALYNAVPESFRNEIDSKYSYSDLVLGRIDNQYDIWMSKLTLDFYIETTKPDLAGLSGTETKYIYSMLYDEINAATIEGGGRIIVATENGTFAPPKGADKGLVYVGFDKDFNVVGIM